MIEVHDRKASIQGNHTIISNHPDIFIPSCLLVPLMLALNVELSATPMARKHTYKRKGDSRSMRQDKLDLIQLLPSPPILNSYSTTIARVAQSMEEDDSGRVLFSGRDDERG